MLITTHYPLLQQQAHPTCASNCALLRAIYLEHRVFIWKRPLKKRRECHRGIRQRHVQIYAQQQLILAALRKAGTPDIPNRALFTHKAGQAKTGRWDLYPLPTSWQGQQAGPPRLGFAVL